MTICDAAKSPRALSTTPLRQTGRIEALLVHSPLVGPSTVSPLAVALSAHGWSVNAPDLRGATNSPRDFSAFVLNCCPKAEVVIGHSGAGAFLPAIADRVDAVVTVFVDAILPGEDPPFLPSQRFVDVINELPIREGLLPPWHQWWPAEAINALIPDNTVREAVVAEISAIPRSFYSDSIDFPRSWWTRPAAYLQLSAAYGAELNQAKAWNWPTIEHTGGHLDLVVHPTEIAQDIVSLIGG